MLTVSELRRLPFGWGLLLNRNGRPILMRMTKWPDRKDAQHIEAATKAYNAELAAELTGGAEVLSSTPTSADTAESGTVADWAASVPVR